MIRVGAARRSCVLSYAPPSIHRKAILAASAHLGGTNTSYKTRCSSSHSSDCRTPCPSASIAQNNPSRDADKDPRHFRVWSRRISTGTSRASLALTGSGFNASGYGLLPRSLHACRLGALHIAGFTLCYPPASNLLMCRSTIPCPGTSSPNQLQL